MTSNGWTDSAGVRGPRWTLHLRGLRGDRVTIPSSARETLPEDVDRLLRAALIGA